jgi:hypothetical protein
MHRRLKHTGRRYLLSFGIAAAVALTARATVLAAEAKVQTILSGLQSPSGVAVRPNSATSQYEVFIADRGAGRVVQISSETPDKSVDAIVGFATNKPANESSATGPGVDSIFFLDHARLVVAGGEQNEKPFARLYDLTDADAALNADESKQEVESTNDGNKSEPAIHSFHDVARTQPNDRVADVLVMAAGSDNKEGDTLWKVPVRASTLGDIAIPVAVKEPDRRETINGVAVGPEGYIVTACSKGVNWNQPSSLRYLSPIDGHVVLAIDTELQRISALAYSPKTGNLYVANQGPNKAAGIYRIDDATQPGKPTCKVVKIAEAARPTALAFGPDGALYATVLGKEGDKDAGALLKITGDL